MRRGPRIAWSMTGVAWLIYGFGLPPAYYSWGFLLPEMIAEFGWTRADGGLVFSLFTFFYSCLGLLVGMAIDRFGPRRTMAAGALATALGLFVVSRAGSLFECIIGFSLLAGLGVGFSTILPCQTLAARWFDRQRARALATIMTAGGVVGLLVPRVDTYFLATTGWRSGWAWMAVISVAVAVFAALAVRDAPEQVGLLPDGREPSEREADASSHEGHGADAGMTRGQALRSPQFAVLTLCGVAFAVPWGLVVSHGRLHLGDLGLSTATVAAIMGTMILVSTAGRLAGSLGDFVAPQTLLGIALALEGAGLWLLLDARTPGRASLATTCLALGFGASYVAISVVMARFFGPAAFATTQGTRMMITGVLNSLGPWLGGAVFDRTGSYAPVFAGLAAITAAGAIGALLVRPPAIAAPIAGPSAAASGSSPAT